MFRSIVYALILLLLIAMPATSTVNAEENEPKSLPLLKPGVHIGTTFFGSGSVPEDEALYNTVVDATNQGMNAFTFYADWNELEPSPGIYDLTELESSLKWFHSLGIQPLLNITMIDVETLTFPDDLLNDAGNDFTDDMAFDDPKIIARLEGLLDEIVPMLAENGGFLLLLGNEVDVHFKENDRSDPTSYTQLIAAARDHVHTLVPEMAVGVTITGTEVLEQGELFTLLRPVTDNIPFNFYPIEWRWWTGNWYSMLPTDDIAGWIDQFMAIYGNDPVIIQELGCPSAADNGSSLDIQAECFDALFDALAAYPNVRYVTVFTLYDWDEPTCDYVVDLFGLTPEMLPDGYFERWRGYLCTLGLLNPDLSPKPAWDVFIAAMNRN